MSVLLRREAALDAIIHKSHKACGNDNTVFTISAYFD